MGAILSLWEDPTSDWDDLPPELQTKIYRHTQADRMLAEERYANAPGGWKHWLRTSAVGPTIEETIRNNWRFNNFNDEGKRRMLIDIVRVITRFEAHGHFRDAPGPAILPVEIHLLRDRDIPPTPGRIRIAVQFMIDRETSGMGANELSPSLKTRYFTLSEYM